jgi:hypothetical protein
MEIALVNFPLTTRPAPPTFASEVDVTVRITNSKCLHMARPSHRVAAAPRLSGRVFMPVAYRTLGVLDSGREGEP